MSHHASLFETRNGTRLPLEICLRVVELAVESDPKSIKHYLGLSKSFQTLLKTFELSIIKTAVEPGQNLYYEVLPSCMEPELVKNIAPGSFRWLSELNSRDMATQCLLHNEGFGMLTTQWTLQQQLAGIHLLYEIADCTAGLKTGRQIDFLNELSPLELATLGAIARSLTLAYEERLLCDKKHNESQKREWACVFENKLIRYGPFFSLASFGSIGDLEFAWTNKVIQDGLFELEEFETGLRPNMAPSLQSQLWSIFSRKMGCTVGDSWFIAQGLMNI